MVAFKALSAIFALSCALARASITHGMSPLVLDQSVVAEAWQGNTINVTLSTAYGLVTYDNNYLVIGEGGPYDTTWTLQRDCNNKKWNVFHQLESGRVNYIQGGDPAYLGTSTYNNIWVLFETPVGESGRLYLKYSTDYCLSFDKEGKGRFRYNTPCTPIFYSEARPKPGLSGGFESCS